MTCAEHEELLRISQERVKRLEEGIAAAPHGFMCRSSRWQRESDAAKASGLKEWASTFTVPEKPDEEHCNCWKKALRPEGT